MDCPYTEEKCNASNCANCNVYIEAEYGCDGQCKSCEYSDTCDHLAEKRN